ncbi:hypothetical protein KAJ83_09650 [Marivibrio halodurans]|uniref:ASCH domain-containing protein n=1 Tax=Marivibrio halodurans TaxID=2039722 RepID=A0A8J7S8D2_9PROT|nr:hypothetical protein [Marivibrio halodurans]MBP5857272.1 hypothetical protein [Marivibrio halodurans]
MVAYNFKSGFVRDIRAGIKDHTVRGNRARRHARPGELVQLYTGMRTKQCTKILDPDPPCTRLDEVALEVGPMAGRFALFEINGIPLDDEAIEAFAAADGFSVARRLDVSATECMVRFWAMTYGRQPFEGVVIHWDPSEALRQFGIS